MDSQDELIVFQVSEQNISPAVTTTKLNYGIRLWRERLLSAWLQIRFVPKINFGSLHQNQKSFPRLYTFWQQG